MKKNTYFGILNCTLLCGMGIFLAFYCFYNQVELKSGLAIIAGTLIGYGIYSTLQYLKLSRAK
ncbi:hypothetical protein P9B03_08695 [Metasolibacillus meyeri]|uniref:Uncharacterized protein n=1 Tax=Metasolibacillus meyeri TaxID=1071052 RepID=A0AAW9NQF1_9BACL|nr:hypothetical protein [Metasolibacillus meyeri]MEC1178557.1 hypothetical protein [Metasolibacillus meyeri]